MGSFATKEDVKLYLGIVSTDYDDLLNVLINRIEQSIKNYCEKDFVQTVYADEKHDGTFENGGILIFGHAPVISVDSLYDDPDCEWGEDTLIESDEYIVYNDPGVLRLLDDVQFSEGIQNIKISYTAGYSQIPTDLTQICVELVSNKFNRRGKTNVTSESLGKWSATYSLDTIPEVQSILDYYKRRTMFVI